MQIILFLLILLTRDDYPASHSFHSVRTSRKQITINKGGIVEDLPISYLNPEDCSAAASAILPFVENKFETNPFLTALTSIIKADKEMLDKSMAFSMKSEFTGQIDSTDTLFDTMFIAFRNHTDSTAQLPKKPEKSGAAQKVSFTISKYGRTLYNLSKQEQIGRMNGLVQELSSPEMQDMLAKAELTELYSEVVSVHNQLVELFTIRAKAEGGASLPAPGECKKPLAIHLYYLYTHMMQATEILGEPYTATAAQIKGVFDKIIPTARARHSRAVQNAIAAKTAKAGTTV